MKVIYILPVLCLAACTDQGLLLNPNAAQPDVVEAAAAVPEVPEAPVTLDPTPPPPPPPLARTVEEFDTTTAEDREAAVTPVSASGEVSLGVTNASLGSVTDPGIFLETGLVTELTTGRVENPATGKSVNLELRPSGGPATAGSQLSLAAMRLLEVPLTNLVDIEVYQN